MTDGRGQRAEDRRQRAEDRWQKKDEVSRRISAQPPVKKNSRSNRKKKLMSIDNWTFDAYSPPVGSTFNLFTVPAGRSFTRGIIEQEVVKL
jgi:hypothetical protein